MRAPYGIDAPLVPTLLSAAAAGCAIGAVVVGVLGSALGAVIFGVYAAYFAVSAGLFLHTSLRGKFAAWHRLLDGIGLRGNEAVLDMGCGRGAVLVAAAGRLTTGNAIGVDLWRRGDQSGNGAAVTMANARAAGVQDRVRLLTSDVTALPLADASVDVIVSSLVVHNIKRADLRDVAMREAVRVLRPGGRLVIVDFRHVKRYAEVLTESGLFGVEIRRLGWRTWFGGPWFACSAVSAAKPGAAR